MIGTMVASIHDIPDTVRSSRNQNSTLTGMCEQLMSQNSRPAGTCLKLHIVDEKRLTGISDHGGDRSFHVPLLLWGDHCSFVSILLDTDACSTTASRVHRRWW